MQLYLFIYTIEFYLLMYLFMQYYHLWTNIYLIIQKSSRYLLIYGIYYLFIYLSIRSSKDAIFILFLLFNFIYLHNRIRVIYLLSLCNIIIYANMQIIGLFI